MRGVCEKQWLICVYLSDSCFIYCISTLATRITLRFRRGFCRGFRQGFLSVMLGCETEGGSSSSSGASSSRRSRTLVVLDVGCLEPFIVKGEPHRLSWQWKRWKRAFNLYVTGKGVSNKRHKRAVNVAGMDVQEI